MIFLLLAKHHNHIDPFLENELPELFERVFHGRLRGDDSVFETVDKVNVACIDVRLTLTVLVFLKAVQFGYIVFIWDNFLGSVVFIGFRRKLN